MPTGYTHAVADGTVTDFSTFALRCARGMGALILMRDDPMDAPIPESFEPSDFYAKALTDARERLAWLESIAAAGGETVEADAANTKALAAWETRRAERRASGDNYRAMLTKALAWTPPTLDHVGLKDLMVQQLQESLKWDCNDTYDEQPALLTGAEWLATETSRTTRNIARYEEEVAKEVERTASRNKWLADLRVSLQPQDAPAAIS
jgi:hypothetical protein